MAKMYAFNEAERAAYLGVKKITHGKGKQIHPRKKWERKGSPGGGSASVTRCILWGEPGGMFQDDSEPKYSVTPAPALKLVWDADSGDAGEWLHGEAITVSLADMAPSVYIRTGYGRMALAINDGGPWPTVFFVGCTEFEFTPPEE